MHFTILAALALVLASTPAVADRPLDDHICKFLAHPKWNCDAKQVLCKSSYPSESGNYAWQPRSNRTTTNSRSTSPSRLDRFRPRDDDPDEADYENRTVVFSGAAYFYPDLREVRRAPPVFPNRWPRKTDCCMPTWECFDFMTNVPTETATFSGGQREWKELISVVIPDVEDWKKAVCCMQNWWLQDRNRCNAPDNRFPIVWWEPGLPGGERQCTAEYGFVDRY